MPQTRPELEISFSLNFEDLCDGIDCLHSLEEFRWAIKEMNLKPEPIFTEIESMIGLKVVFKSDKKLEEVLKWLRHPGIAHCSAMLSVVTDKQACLALDNHFIGTLELSRDGVHWDACWKMTWEEDIHKPQDYNKELRVPDNGSLEDFDPETLKPLPKKGK